MIPAQHVVLDTVDAPHVRVTLTETYHQRIYETGTSIEIVNQVGARLTDAAVIAELVARNQIDPNARQYISVWENTPRPYVPDENGNYIHSYSINQYDLSDPQERPVEMLIPRGDLPTPYTHADIVAWGKAAGLLNL